MIEYLAIAITIITILILTFLFYHGFLTPVRIHNKQKVFGPCQYLYFNQRMDYAESWRVWKDIRPAMNKHFKFSLMAGIYYDPPQLVEDKENSRITFGIIVNSGEVKNIQKFQQEFPNYQLTTLQNVDAIYAEYPYRNLFSFFLAVKKVYPILNQYLMSSKICAKSIMEVYDTCFEQKISFLAFYGDKADQYVLHPEDPPKYKST